MSRPNFQSSDWCFRPTSLGAAMAAAGMDIAPALVREPKSEINGRKLRVNTSTAGAFGKTEVQTSG